MSIRRSWPSPFTSSSARSDPWCGAHRRVLGNEHPATLYSAAVLATALVALGEAPAARELAEDALARCWRVVGNDHPTTRVTKEVLRRLDQEGQQARQE